MRCLTFDTNVKSRATSQFKQFNFSSMTVFNGEVIGVNDLGMFRHTGADDDGTVISAWMKTGMTDLGIQANKRMRYVYLGLETDGDLELELYADEVLVKTIPVTASKDGQQTVRFSVGRAGQKGVHWAFLIRNTSGARFAIDSIQVLPVVRHYGDLP